MNKEGLILIVEDDSINKAMIRKLFEEQYDVLEASNGREALELIAEHAAQLSVIILDLYMPEVDGYKVLERMGENAKWSDIPVVITTSENSVQSDQRLLDLGARVVTHKPLNPGLLKRHIRNIVGREKQHKDFMKDYVLQKTLIHKSANTFSVAYHFADQTYTIEESYQEYLAKDFVKIFDGYPFGLQEFVLPQNLEEAVSFFDIQNKEKLHDEIELRLRIDPGHYEWFKIAAMIQCGADGRRDNAVMLFTNIEFEVEAKEELIFMATNDPLTRIPNLRTFNENVRELLDTYPDEQFVMITMDIQQFQMINKLFGHTEGDGVLRYLATKLQEIVESFDKGLYCRIASDVFFTCFSEHEDLDEFLTTMQEEMKHYPLKIDLRLYFGIYQITDRDEEVEFMIEHASYARRTLKKSPSHNVQYYDTELREKEFFEEVVVAEMEQAMKEQQFEVHYQPKCNLHNGQITGAEALVRWNNPEKGYLSPGIFVPVLEQNGFITELDYYVYDSVCRQLAEWISQGIKPVPVSVNVSRCDLYDTELFDRILRTVAQYNVPHDLIEFEITESAFILERNLLAAFTEKLRANGFRVLIDDFGSGYSSLNSLKNIDVDILKIDIAFLPVSMDEVKSTIILNAVLELAQNLGLDAIAEGVETEEQRELLEQLGCHEVQGYFYYRPMPVEQYEKLLTERQEA